VAQIIGKRQVGRLETLQYANKKFNWGNVVIGISCFFGFWAWVLARLTRRKCIYYCIDFYSPEIIKTSFDRVFTRAAMAMDKFLFMHCDTLWDISERIDEGRRKFGNYPVRAINHPHIIVPLSYPPSYFRYHRRVIKKRVVFVGFEPYGLELINDYPFFEWLGKKEFVPLDVLLDNLSWSGIGISCWKDKGNNYYGDPGKTKLYSACGLPVIMTDNTPYAAIIKETEAGIVVPYDKQAVAEAINQILSNYHFYKHNVRKTWRFINADYVFADRTILEC